MSEARQVVVTGAAGAIGSEVAAAFATDGASLHLVDRSPSVVRLADQLGAKPYECDVTSEAQLEQLRSIDEVHVLVNAVGWWPATPFTDLSRQEWDTVLAVNLTAPMRVTQLLVNALRDGAGAVVNLASGSVFRGGPPGHAAYISAKAGLIGLTRALARELGPEGIRVNAVSPGLVDTDVNRSRYSDAAFDAVIAGRSIHRAQVASDLVGAILFLASTNAGFITGQTLVVDGGGVFL